MSLVPLPTDFEVLCGDPVGRDRFIRLDVIHTQRRIDTMVVHARSDALGRLAIDPDGFLLAKHAVGVLQALNRSLVVLL